MLDLDQMVLLIQKYKDIIVIFYTTRLVVIIISIVLAQ